MIIKIIKWILVILCMISIFLFSADTSDESDLKSNGLIIRIAEVLAGRKLNDAEKDEKIEKYVVLVRKGAHFSIYFLLGFLIINLLVEYREESWKTLFFAFVLSFFYACSDEFHQLFVPGRSGNIIDVWIDSIGSYVGVLFYHFIYLIRRKYE